MPELVPGYEAHGLGDGVERDVLPFPYALPAHLHRELLVPGVAVALGAVVREEQQDVLRQDTALQNVSILFSIVFVTARPEGQSDDTGMDSKQSYFYLQRERERETDRERERDRERYKFNVSIGRTN